MKTDEKKTIDVPGVGCPMNFVKLKMELSRMSVSEEINAILDDDESIDRVPHSLQLEGHEIISQEMEEESWKLTIKKGI